MTTEKNTFTCSSCKTETHKFEMFPNSMCLDCYEEQWEKKQQGKTEKEIAQDLYNDITSVFGK